MRYQYSLSAVIEANKLEYATHCLLNILSTLSIKSAYNPTLGDVRNFIDKTEERRYIALLEVLGVDK